MILYVYKMKVYTVGTANSLYTLPHAPCTEALVQASQSSLN